MPYLKIEKALLVCKSYLDTIDEDFLGRLELESIVVGGLVVLIVSEYEKKIEHFFIERAQRCGDPDVAMYVKSAINEKFRSPDLSKITETLGRFNKDCRVSFVAEIENTEYHAAWDNIIKARHAVVHKKGVLNLTFRELSTSYPKTKKILSEISRVLKVDSAPP